MAEAIQTFVTTISSSSVKINDLNSASEPLKAILDAFKDKGITETKIKDALITADTNGTANGKIDEAEVAVAVKALETLIGASVPTKGTAEPTGTTAAISVEESFTLGNLEKAASQLLEYEGIIAELGENSMQKFIMLAFCSGSNPKNLEDITIDGVKNKVEAFKRAMSSEGFVESITGKDTYKLEGYTIAKGLFDLWLKNGLEKPTIKGLSENIKPEKADLATFMNHVVGSIMANDSKIDNNDTSKWNPKNFDLAQKELFNSSNGKFTDGKANYFSYDGEVIYNKLDPDQASQIWNSMTKELKEHYKSNIKGFNGSKEHITKAVSDYIVDVQPTKMLDDIFAEFLGKEGWFKHAWNKYVGDRLLDKNCTKTMVGRLRHLAATTTDPNKLTENAMVSQSIDTMKPATFGEFYNKDSKMLEPQKIYTTDLEFKNHGKLTVQPKDNLINILKKNPAVFDKLKEKIGIKPINDVSVINYLLSLVDPANEVGDTKALAESIDPKNPEQIPIWLFKAVFYAQNIVDVLVAIHQEIQPQTPAPTPAPAPVDAAKITEIMRGTKTRSPAAGDMSQYPQFQQLGQT